MRGVVDARIAAIPGPYYLATILSVLVLASDLISASIYAWLALALLIVCGAWVIWWTTEHLMGQILERLMSAIGTKRTFVCAAVMSAFGGKGTS
jgi:hypothetical protein